MNCEFSIRVGVIYKFQSVVYKAMDRLKVDQTLLSAQNNYIYVTNVNIPTVYFGDPTLKQRIHNLVDREYNQEIEVFFEISAAYTLIHGETGSTRTWVGSFSPQQIFALTHILNFRQDFDRTITPLLDLDYLTVRLNNLFPDSVWTLHSIQSLIVNLQGLVPLQYSKITQRNLHNVRGKARRHINYDLP